MTELRERVAFRGRMMCAIAGAIALIAHPAPLHAQARDSAAVRDSARAPRPRPQTLAPVDVRASVVPSAGPSVRIDVPAQLSIVSGRSIDAWEPVTLAQALGAQVGISLFDDLGSPMKLNVSSRGFGVGPTLGNSAGMTVFLDGVRQNEPDAQEVNFDLLPMEHVARVELLGGTGSLLGPNSLGGVINLITERGRGAPHGEVELTGGSFGERAGEANVSGRTAGGWDYYAGGGVERTRGWRDATGARNENLFVNGGRLGERRGLGVQLYAAHSRAETAGSLPESIARVDPRTNFTAGDHDDLHGAQGTVSGYAPFAGGSASIRAYLRGSDAERFNVNQTPDPDALALTRNRTVGASGDWRRSLLGDALDLRLGFDAATNRVRVRIRTVAHDAAGPDTTLTTDVTSPSSDVAGFALADVHVSRATFSLGTRWDRVHVPFDDRLDPSGSGSSTYTHVSPRAGVSVALGLGASVYASVGRSFRAPAALELACADPEATCPLPFALGDDPPLKPVRGTTLEAGARWLVRSVIASGTLYRTDVRDEIFFVSSPQALLAGYFTNLARTRREGAELSLEGGAFDQRLSWYANTAWTRATFASAASLFSIRSEDDFAGSPLAGANVVRPGDRLPLVPTTQTKAGALLRLTRRWELGADARWIGSQWLRGDEANETRPLAAYAEANGRVGYRVRGWQLSAIVENVFDSKRATFGTFNANRASGALERFVTPLGARALRVVVRRSLGPEAPDE